MPELPEVETIVRRLNDVLVDNSISKISVLRDKSFQGNQANIIGQKITKVSRRAKIIIISLENNKTLIIHLKMTGQLIYQSDNGSRLGGGHPTDDWVNALPARHTRVVMNLQNGTLYFNDMRVFGWIKEVTEDDLHKELSNYGPDIIDPNLTLKYFADALSRRSSAIKQTIMDNAVIAGVGNIYANDALNLAKINPTRKSNSLSSIEVKKLFESMRKVITLGIELGGATIDNYRNVDGLAGGYQNKVRVYQKEGEPCPNCGVSIIRIKQGGRSTFYCPNCQV